MNSVIIVGVCIALDDISLTLRIENDKDLIMFFESEEDVQSIEIGVLTKVEGYLDIREFPFPVVIIKKVYQISQKVC